MERIGDAKKGDIVRFKGHSLRVEAEPKIKGGRIYLEGRESREGCPYVRRSYLVDDGVVAIERETGV